MVLRFSWLVALTFSLFIQPSAFAGKRCGGQGDWRSSLIPDQWGNAKFYKACKNHDDCYGTLGANKDRCDTDFRRHLEKECRRNNPTPDCFAAVELYASSVARMGGDAYRSAQANPESNRNPTIHGGFYMLDSGAVIFSNGDSAYCGYVSEEHFAFTGAPWGEARKNPARAEQLDSLDNHGLCKVAIPAGDFSINGQPEVYFSNGQDAYCHVPSPSLVHSGVRQYAWNIREASNFAFHGVCSYGISLGFFAVRGQPEIYFSNGKDAYCWVPHPRFVQGEPYVYDFNIHAFTHFRKDGPCGGMN